MRIRDIVLLTVAGIMLVSCARSPQAREARYLKSGKAFFDKKDYPRATLEFLNAAQVMPKDAEPFYYLGLTYLAGGSFRDAVVNLQRAVKLNPKHLEARVKLSELMTTSSMKEVLEEAERGVEQVLVVEPNNVEALTTLAMAQWKLGKREDAERHLMDAFNRMPQHIQSLVALAKVKLIKRDMKGAEELLRKAAAENPPTLEVLVALGEFYAATGRLTEAEPLFRRASEADPKNGTPLIDLAEVQLRSGRADDAEQTYKRLAAFPDKKYKPVHAAFLFARGKRAEAIAEFERLSKEDPEDRQARTRLIAAYVSGDRVSDAERCLDVAIRKNSKDVEALLQRSAIYVGKGKFSEVEALIRQVLQFVPESGEAHYLLSKVHHGSGATLAQRQELTEAIKYNPFLLAARIELSELLITTGAAKQALQVMNESPERGNIRYVLQRNWALLAAGQKDELARGIQEGIKLGEVPALFLQAALLKFLQKDYAGTRTLVAETLKRSPGDEHALEVLARSYLVVNQPEEAVNAVRKQVAQRPDFAPAQLFLGRLLVSTGNRPEARKAFVAARAADPKLVRADLALTELDIADGKLDDARKTAEAVLASNRATANAHLLLGEIEERSQHVPAAIAHYQKVLDLQPENMTALNNLAYELAETGEHEQALKYAERAKELAPENPLVDDTLGWVYYRKGLYSMAVRHLESAASKQGTTVIKSHLAMAYFRAGKQQKSRETLAAVLRTAPNSPEAKMASDIVNVK